MILPHRVWSKVPFSQWRENADWFLENLVTNGPFRLAAWDRQQQIVLERYPGAPDTERALEIMVEAYQLLGMTDLANDARRVLAATRDESEGELAAAQ